MGKQVVSKTVQTTKPELRELCTCPLCKKRAMDILNEETAEIKCPQCGNFVPIPLDKEQRALMVAESKLNDKMNKPNHLIKRIK